MILLADAHVKVHAEPDAQDIEVQVAALHGRRALAFQVADLEGVHRAGLPEEVPRRVARARVLRVGEVRAGDDGEVLLREDVQRRADRLLGSAGHHQGRAASELDGEELERGRDEQDARLDADGLAVGVRLVQEDLYRLLERVRRERARRAGEEVLVVRGEERLAVRHSRVRQETLEEELVDKTGRTGMRRRWRGRLAALSEGDAPAP